MGKRRWNPLPPRQEKQRVLVSLQVEDIRYSQSTISHVFCKGPPTIAHRYGEPGVAGQPLHEVVAEMCKGRVCAEDFPLIRVVQWPEEDGAYYSLDNRRLWVLKAADVCCINVLKVRCRIP
jgi:hypothetical protein